MFAQVLVSNASRSLESVCPETHFICWQNEGKINHHRFLSYAHNLFVAQFGKLKNDSRRTISNYLELNLDRLWMDPNWRLRFHVHCWHGAVCMQKNVKFNLICLLRNARFCCLMISEIISECERSKDSLSVSTASNFQTRNLGDKCHMFSHTNNIRPVAATQPCVGALKAIKTFRGRWKIDKPLAPSTDTH